MSPSLALRKEEAPSRRSKSFTELASVEDLVASKPWAFVVAGLAAVLLGVAVLWALGGD